MSRASSVIVVDDQIAKRAADFVQQGVKATDALHLAAAEAANVDYFCTCDDRFSRRAKDIDDLHTVVVSPLELIESIET